MYVLVAYKNEEDQSKVKVLEQSQHYSLISEAQGQLTPVSDGILLKFKFIQAFMVDLATCKNEEDSSENEGTRMVTTFLPL